MRRFTVGLAIAALIAAGPGEVQAASPPPDVVSVGLVPDTGQITDVNAFTFSGLEAVSLAWNQVPDATNAAIPWLDGVPDSERTGAGTRNPVDAIEQVNTTRRTARARHGPRKPPNRSWR